MKAINWFSALAVLGASAVAAGPASALVCWTPSELEPIDISTGSLTSYVDCYGANNFHAEASATRKRDQFNGKWYISVSVVNGDFAQVWGYDNNRNYVGCFARKDGIGSSFAVQCTGTPTWVQLEAWDNTP